MDRSGYSLIEMITVVVVLGLMLAMTTLSMSPSISRSKVHGAANVLAGDLMYAQLLAVRHRTPIAIIVTEATRQYMIRERDDITAVYRTRSLGEDTDFALEALTASPTTVEVFPNGVARQETTFTLSLNGYDRRVLLTRAGQVRILRL